MMTNYVLTHPKKGRIEYTDKKRWLWVSAILFSMLPLPVIVLFLWSGNPWVLVAPLGISFVLIPIVDWLVGTDTSNPPEEIVPQLNVDPHYRWLIVAAIPVPFIVIAVSAWLVATHSLPIGFFIAFSVVMGLYGGVSINTAHEIGHKTSKLERFLSRVVLAATGYGHFCIEHNLGHHRDVATPEDSSSARMGESVYRFMLREVPGALLRGWQVERQRLVRYGRPVWGIHNHILQSYAMTLVFQGGLILWLGWVLIPFFILHNLAAWFQLTSANYIEHYGLWRNKKPNGKYERCQPHHSWNANHLVSNLLLFQLERHSDHHANPARSYQSLRSFENLPELPAGYPTMYLLAYVPWLWFFVMDKRLMGIPHINGDLNRVNIDPANEARIRAHWDNSRKTTSKV
jgi:alkane 1-monooxygenase